MGGIMALVSILLGKIQNEKEKIEIILNLLRNKHTNKGGRLERMPHSSIGFGNFWGKSKT
jgi:hypothetical protein